MADKLTLKQERFAWEYTRNGGNASQAYRDVYACNGSSDDTIAKRAHELRHDGKIAGRIDRLEQEQQRVARLDRNSVLGMLLATYDKAVQCDQTGPAARFVWN
jgi:phage terminase small subunit